MVAVEDILTDSLSATISDWFDPKYKHPFMNINVLVIPDSTKSIPHRWVDDVQIDDLFRGDDGDLMAIGGASNTWSAEDGRQRLLQALHRLDLSESHVAHPNLDRMGRHEFGAEKRRVKQELKRYDAEFRKQFGRLPSHTEKEPMRPLYVYYRRLKTMLAQVEQSRLGRNSRTGTVGAPWSGDEVPLRFEPRESLTTIPDMDETPRAGKKGPDVETQISALEVRIENLQSEKAAVRAKLQTFQEKFVGENNRKIRFHKDILPIEREYRMYKNLKEDIAKAEQQLRDLKAGES